jgi:hypothetical protein
MAERPRAGMPIVSIVTPADQKTPSVEVFIDELDNYLGRKGTLNYQYFEAKGDNSKLDQLASNAATSTPAPAVIVAAGSLAASLVQKYTTTIPIVQAAGGSNIASGNLTGFSIDAQHISQDQLATLVNTFKATTITVLYDHTNYPTNPPPILTALLAFATTLNPPPTIIQLDMQDVTSIKPTNIQGNGFMLLPNADFYENCKVIAKAVEKAGVPAVYPEREYKKAHQNKTNIKVRGHSIQLTFRRAAYFVDSLLDDPSFINSLKFQEAIPDED